MVVKVDRSHDFLSCKQIIDIDIDSCQKPMQGRTDVGLTKNSSLGIDAISWKTKGDALFHLIRRAILLRELQAGEALKEPQIGRDFHCSQGTVREALMRLQEEGLVKRRGYSGTTVTRSSLNECVQMAEIRIKLEMEGIRHAVEAFTDDDFDEVEGCLSDMDRAADQDDFYALSELDRRFHQTLFHRSGMTALEPILTRCMLHMHLQTFGHSVPAHQTRQLTPTEAHQPILDAVRRRSADDAAAALCDHINLTINQWSPPLKSAMNSR